MEDNFRFYFADVGFIPKLDHDINYGANRILNSFAFQEHVLESLDKRYGRGHFSKHIDKKGRSFEERKNPNLKLFLDSGAYTLWSKNKEVDINAYIKFIKDLGANEFEIIANLDKIPGKPGVPETAQDLEDAASKGWDNLLYIEKHGITPLHIFHQGEDFKWLKKVSEHQQYIGISPNNLAPTKEKMLWLDRVFHFLNDGKGKCRNKTHGFGVSSIPLMLRYPWFSCDSSTWSMGRRSGIIKLFLPKHKHLFGLSIAVSDKVGTSANKFHYDLLDSGTKKIVDEYFKEFELDLEGMRTTHEARDKANILFFKHLEKYIDEKDVHFNRAWGDLF